MARPFLPSIRSVAAWNSRSAPFGLARRGAHLGRPIGPDAELVLPLWRLRADVELGDRERALAEGRADAVGGRVAAADHDDMLAAGQDRRFAGHIFRPTRRFCCTR